MKVDVLGMWKKAQKARLFSTSPRRKTSVYSAGKTRWVTVVSRWHGAEEAALLELLAVLSFVKSPIVQSRLGRKGERNRVTCVEWRVPDSDWQVYTKKDRI